MRNPAICLLAVAAFAATSFGQTLEKTIWLPDSNVGLDEPTVVFHNPLTNRVYFAGYWSDWIQVYDANTKTKAWRIDTLACCPALAHCYNEHEVWALTDEGYIIVINDRTDSMVTTLPSPYASDIAYNATMHKAYVLDCDWNQVLVYEVPSRTRVDSIQLHDWADFIVWDSVFNRVYALGWDWEYYPIVAIDCTEDSIAEVMAGPWFGEHLLVHPTRNKLYCVGAEDSAEHAQLWVYNTEDLTVSRVITLPFQSWCPGFLTLNTVNDMLYAGYREPILADRHRRRPRFWPEDTVAVFDCSSDTLVGFVSLGEDVFPSAYCVNEQENKVYIALYDLDSVAVLCAPDSIAYWMGFSGPLTAVEWNPQSNEMYMCDDCGYIWILDGATDSIVNEVDYEGRYVRDMVSNHDLEKLYIENSRGIGWLGTGDSLEHWFWYRRWLSYGVLAYSCAGNRIYLEDYLRLQVYDCEDDSIVRVVPLPDDRCHRGIALDPVGKLYLPNSRGECVVYDTERDSVLHTIPGFGTRFMYQPTNGLVYGWGHDELVTVIDPYADTLVASHSGWDVRDLAVNETDNEAYFFVADYPASVYAMDGESHEVSHFITLTDTLKALLWVDSLNFLACICGDSTLLVDCRTQQVVRTYFRGNSEYSTWGLDRTNAILYDGTPPGHVTAMHCGMDSAVVFDVAAHRFCWDENRGGMFGAFYNAIHVFSYDPVGIGNQAKSKVRTRETLPTIVRGVLQLPAGADAVLLDATGRRVVELPGALESEASGAVRRHDIRHIAPGVYFLRSADSGERPAVRKVVVQR